MPLPALPLGYWENSFLQWEKKSHVWRGEEEAPSLPEACGPPGAVSRMQPWSVLFSMCQGCGVVVCCSSVAKLCPTLCNPMDCSTAGFPGLPRLPELAQSHVHWSVMPSNHLILCRPLLLLPSVFPSTRVFSSESTLCIRWLKY